MEKFFYFFHPLGAFICNEALYFSFSMKIKEGECKFFLPLFLHFQTIKKYFSKKELIYDKI